MELKVFNSILVGALKNGIELIETSFCMLSTIVILDGIVLEVHL